MALHVGLRRAPRAGGDRRLFRPAGRARTTGRGDGARRAGEPPPILLVHGDQDAVDPARSDVRSRWTNSAAAEHSHPMALSFGVGHGIDGGGLRHGGLFIAKAFGIKAR